MKDFLEFISSHAGELKEQVLEHLLLTLISVTLAVIVGLLLGIAISRNKKRAGPVMGVVNAVQTIPSLALLGVLLPLVGIGVVPAIIALFLYALLPIVRNTYTGIIGIDPAVKEAATGMGLNDIQLLRRVEIPLAMPVIFAGIRTAFVINVGIATLCALIAAGGLGEFIFRGLGTNNPQMILAGAIPASLLALLIDAVLGYLQRNLATLLKPAMIVYLVAMLLLALWYFDVFSGQQNRLEAGFPSEFIEREDGYRGLAETYNLNLELKELSIGLMYDALRNRDVDVISGFSTDGRIIAYDLYILEDDKQYFPPYYAAPVIRQETLDAYPGIESALRKLNNAISDEEMAQMNFDVDEQHRPITEVARDFLKSKGFNTKVQRDGEPDIHIGSKDFTESYLLAEIFKQMIENYTDLTAELHLGFGGTKLLFDATNAGEIDLYPEYTGTGLLVILPRDAIEDSNVRYEKDQVYELVKREFLERYGIVWGPPLGFNNTFALMMRS
ncbi:MAG: ABC transporter permease/substrate-binding protein, partial [Cyclobacteriaceae bacterium]